MKLFDKSSKPKVLYFGNHNIETATIDLIAVSYINISLIKELNPDLIVTDSSDIDCLNKSDYSIRKKWVILSDTNVLHSQSTFAGLIRNDKLVSVYTSVYNTGSKIIDTYISLRLQSYKDWEWVIVDDGNDNTLDILKSFTRDDPRVKIYSFKDKSNGNIGEAKFRAVSLCNGKYIVELDHDDILTSDCLEYIVKAFDSNDEFGFVYSDCVEYNIEHGYNLKYPDGFSFGYGKYYKVGKYEPSVVAPLNQLTIRHIVSVPNHVRAWRKSIYNNIGGYNRYIRIADDYELIVRSFLHTKFCYIPKMLYIQRYDGNNSQDKGDNRNDIQLRVNEIARFYDKDITARFKELGFDDPCAGMSAVEAYNKIDKSILNNCNEIFNIN